MPMQQGWRVTLHRDGVEDWLRHTLGPPSTSCVQAPLSSRQLGERGREGRKEGGREGERERGREGEREGGREGEREEGEEGTSE